MASLHPIGSLHAASEAAFDGPAIAALASDPRRTLHVVREGIERDGVRDGRIGIALGGEVTGDTRRASTHPLLATLPPLYPEWLGDRAFCEAHALRFPYVTGEMANGIATPRLVIAMARAHMLGFFGAAGLVPARVEKAIVEIASELEGSGLSWGANLIHSPQEPDIENAVCDLFLRYRVARVCASAFMALTPAVVRYATAGLRVEGGRIVRDTNLFAKVSRPELAETFMSPAPPAILDALVRDGKITREQSELARRVPLACDVTIEADSGGHTDNRPLSVLLPLVLGVRDRITRKLELAEPIRVGASGGLGTPAAVAAAFAMGASYVLTGSVNQAAIESGLSEEGRRMLATAGMADVIMAPAADMFEMGVKVQVLKRGTMFGPRALKLYELYRDHASLESIPTDVRERLERDVLGAKVDEIWSNTKAYFTDRDPREVARADRDPKHRMALVFRWYLGLSSRWAIDGDPKRKLDYQIWCGPAMGAFNEWAKGSFLEAPERRTAVQIALNLMEGAAVVTRAQQLRTYGVPVPPAAFHFAPRPLG